MKRIRLVLYATDLSAVSLRAFTMALTIAKSARAKLIILHVMAPVMPTVPEQYVDAVRLHQLEKQSRRWRTRQLKKLADTATSEGVRAASELRDGDPVQKIIRAARSKRADLIVVGTHGRRGLPRFFLGSVAERVLRMAPCTVVMVRASR